MGRRDLTEMEIREMRRWANTLEPHRRDQVERLAGEVLQLRERESTQRHLAGLEE